MIDEDLKIESWPPKITGGQHVGRISVGVKATHVPTGIASICATERSQRKNLTVAKAMIEWGLTEIGWVDSSP